MLDEELLDMLACPACVGGDEEDGATASSDEPRGVLDLEDDRLICRDCGRRYPVRDDGIPVMLIEEAELPADEGSAE